MLYAGQCVVVGVFGVTSLSARLLISAHQEDPVVGARAQDDHRRQCCREDRDLDDLVLRQERDGRAGHGQRQPHPEKRDHRGDHGPVDEQQHGTDQQRAHRHQQDDGVVDRDHLVVDDGRRPGDVHVDAGWRRRRGDGVTRCLGRFHGERGAHVAGEVHQDVGDVAVGTLRGRGEVGVRPQVHRRVDVLGVRGQLGQQVGVVRTGFGPKGFVALHQDVDEVVAAPAAEVLTHLDERLHGRRLVGQEGLRMFGDRRFQLRYNDVETTCDEKPDDDDRYRTRVEKSRESWPRGVATHHVETYGPPDLHGEPLAKSSEPLACVDHRRLPVVGVHLRHRDQTLGDRTAVGARTGLAYALESVDPHRT